MFLISFTSAYANKTIFQNQSGTDMITLDKDTGNVTSVGWFEGLFNWIVNPFSASYFAFNGSTLDFNETFLNITIEGLSLNETDADGLYVNINGDTMTGPLYSIQDEPTRAVVQLTNTNESGLASFQINNSGSDIVLSLAGSDFPITDIMGNSLENAGGLFITGGNLFIATNGSKNITFGNTKNGGASGVNFTLTILPTGEILVAGDIDMSSKFGIKNLFELVAFDGSAIGFGDNVRFNSGKFSGLDQAIIIGSNQTLGPGVVTHALLDTNGEKVIEAWQSGKNNSWGFHRNSYGIFGDLGITNASILTNGRTMWDIINITSFLDYDTATQGASLGVQYGMETQKIFIHNDLGNGQFLMDGGDFRVISDGGDIDLYEGAVHIQDQEIRQLGEIAGANITFFLADFTNGLTPFELITIGKGIDEWATAGNGDCPLGGSSPCGHAGPTGGRGDTIMQSNFTTNNLQLKNLTFLLNTDSMASGGDFEVTMNNNTGSGDVSVYSLVGADVLDGLINVSIPSSMDNQSIVSMEFIFSSTHPNRGDTWVDNVEIDGEVITSALVNQTLFDGEVEFGDGSCRIKVNGTDNSMTFGGTGCGEMIFQGNTTFETINVADQNVTGGITATENITTQEWFNGKFNWTTSGNWITFDGATLTMDDANLEVAFNQTQTILDNNESWLGTYNATYAAWAYNQSTPYDDFNYNQTEADGTWHYNQTTPANTYTDTEIGNINTTGNIQNLLNGTGIYSTYNLTYFGAVNNASYLSTYNATYDAITGGNASWNETLANTLYAGIQWAYNQSYPFVNGTWDYNMTTASSGDSHWNLTGNMVYPEDLNYNVSIGKVTTDSKFGVLATTGNTDFGLYVPTAHFQHFYTPNEDTLGVPATVGVDTLYLGNGNNTGNMTTGIIGHPIGILNTYYPLGNYDSELSIGIESRMDSFGFSNYNEKLRYEFLASFSANEGTMGNWTGYAIPNMGTAKGSADNFYGLGIFDPQIIGIYNLGSSILKGNMTIGNSTDYAYFTNTGDLNFAGSATRQISFDKPIWEFDLDGSFHHILNQTTTSYDWVGNGAVGQSFFPLTGNAYFSGDVGIGTDSPNYNLHIQDNVGSNILIHTNKDNPSNSSLLFRSALTATDDKIKAGIFFENDGAGNGQGDMHLALENTNDASNVGIADAVMTLTHEGFVGIGTATPTHKLNVVGDINATGDVCTDSGNCLNSVSGSGPWVSTATTIYNTTASVGIGTASPDSTLQVEGTFASGTSDVISNGSYSTALGRASISSGTYSFATGYGSQATDLSSMGIGYFAKATGSQSVAIGDSALASGSQSIALGYKATSSGIRSLAIGREFNVSGTDSVGIALADMNGATVVSQAGVMSIMGGEVGIGTVSPNAKLHVNGTTHLGGSVVIDGSTFTTVKIKGTVRPQFFMQDQGATSGEQIAGMVDADGKMVFQSRYDNDSVRVNNIINMDHSTGFVGINTASPSATLGVDGNIRMFGSNGGFIVNSRDGSGEDYQMYNPTGDDMRFYASGDQFIITNDGDIEITRSILLDGEAYTSDIGISMGDDDIWLKDDGRLIFGDIFDSIWEWDDANGYLSMTGTLTGGNQIFSAYSNTGSATFTTTPVGIPFDVEERDDSFYTHATTSSPISENITVLKTGDYMVEFDASVDVSVGTARSTARCYIEVNDVEDDGSRCFTYNRLAGGGDSTCHTRKIITLTANDMVRIECVRHTGTDTLQVTADGSRINLEWVE